MENKPATTVNDIQQELSQPNEPLDAAKSPSPSSSQWLLWTGVLGAFLALLSLLVIMLLGQRLLTLEETQSHALVESKQRWQDQQLLWEKQQQQLRQDQQTLAIALRQEVADDLIQLEARIKASQQYWSLADVKLVQLMTAQLQGLTLLSVEPEKLLAFLTEWQGLLAQQEIDVTHPLRLALTQEAQQIMQLSTTRNRMDDKAWRVWQGLIDYHAPNLAEGLITPTSEVALAEEAPWWNLLLKFVRITPAEQIDGSRLTQLRDASLWQTQASMALTQLRWGLQTDQPQLVQTESQHLADLLAVMNVVLPESMSAQMVQWQRWAGWDKPDWQHLRDYIAQSAQAKP